MRSTAHMDLPSDCFSDGFLLEASYHPREDTWYRLQLTQGSNTTLCCGIAFSHPTSIVRKAITVILVLGELGSSDRCTHYYMWHRDRGNVFDKCF
jgi:hypothetical protein